MTPLDWTTLAVSAASFVGLLCRIFAVSWATHRHSVVGGLVLLAILSIIAGSLAAQGQADASMLVVVAAVSLYLLATWADWRNGPPQSIRRAE